MSLLMNDLPEELVKIVKALTDETRRGIVLSLFDRDSISYSQIQNSFQVKKGTLNHHLHILVSSGLIRNFSITSPANPYKSYYAITDFGRKFVEALRQTLEPKIVWRIATATSTTITDELAIGGASEGKEKRSEELATAEIHSRGVIR